MALTCLDGLAWDWITKTLYWTDVTRGHINVMDPLTNKGKTLLTSSEGSRLRAIVLDPTTRYEELVLKLTHKYYRVLTNQRSMYWTDWGSSPKIEKASMDGNSREAIVTDSLGSPSGLAMDYSTQTLYWTDPTLHMLEKCSYDGSDRMVISSMVTNPFGITVHQSTLYWGDLENTTIYSAPISNPNLTTVVIARLIYEPLEIHMVSEERQPLGKHVCVLRQKLSNLEMSALIAISTLIV